MEILNSINTLNSIKINDNKLLPLQTSIVSDEDFNNLSDKDKKKVSKIKWKKISEVYTNYKLMDNPSYDDILQGKLGNCYLLSVLGTFALYPERLKKLFANSYNLSDEYNIKIIN